jgi:hypothetical protein
MFSEVGVDLNKFDSVNGRPQLRHDPRNDLNPRNDFVRQEMSGPKNIDSILSGLKPKSVNIQENKDSDSMISASSLKDLNGDVPRSRRKKGSDRNIVSLDI